MGTPEPFPLPQEGEFGCQILSFHPGKDSPVEKWGFKPSSSDTQGLPPLLGHRGFSQEGKDPPRAASEAK